LPIDVRVVQGGGVGEGAIAGAFGGRKPPSSAYATFAPAFAWDAVDDDFVGGLFWDGRATGAVTGEPAGDQAIGPFLNQKEHAMGSKADVLAIINGSSSYKSLWKKAWGVDFSMATTQEIDENFKKTNNEENIKRIYTSNIFEIFTYFRIFAYFIIVSSFIWIRLYQFLNDILKKFRIAFVNFSFVTS
jgi:cytochrome c peroxidase